jgi:hypothetical protein
LRLKEFHVTLRPVPPDKQTPGHVLVGGLFLSDEGKLMLSLPFIHCPHPPSVILMLALGQPLPLPYRP